MQGKKVLAKAAATNFSEMDILKIVPLGDNQAVNSKEFFKLSCLATQLAPDFRDGMVFNELF